MSELVIIEKESLANIADKVREISGSTESMNALDIGENLGNQIGEVKEVLTEWLSKGDVEVGEGSSLKDMADAVAGIEAGNTDVEDGFITKTLTEISNSRVPNVANFAFYQNYSLTTVNLPEAIHIGISAFAYCSKLASVNLPKASILYSAVFEGCGNITTVSFPMVTNIRSNAFMNCSNLTNANFPMCVTVGQSAFYGCYKLATVSFPTLNTISASAFIYCSSLQNISLPSVTNIRNSAFKACSNLSTLYLMGSSLCSLSNSNAFSQTGITSSTGSIYVPTSLLPQYQSATNWAYFSTRFVGVDGPGGHPASL